MLPWIYIVCILPGEQIRHTPCGLQQLGVEAAGVGGKRVCVGGIVQRQHAEVTQQLARCQVHVVLLQVSKTVKMRKMLC